jgi:glucose uptake protein GlcU
VGTGSTTAVEGPVAGVIGALVVTFALALFPPSAGHSTLSMWLLGVLTAACCPLGQLAGSVLLPSGGSFAPALRRLDSLLVAGPLWAVVVLRWWT